MKTILELSAEDAKKYMLKGRQYCSFRLPEYFDFDKLLEWVENVIGKKSDEQCYAFEIKKKKEKNKVTRVQPSSFDEINYLLYSNKDGKLDYRPLAIINPFYYYFLVRLITKPDSWKEIKNRFEFLRDSHISVESTLVAEDDKDRISIINWWSTVEQKTIELSLQYKYLFVTDIKNFYGSIYTHSIAWAMMGKEEAKLKRSDSALLGNKLDHYFQGMQYGQTNSIPQGNVVSDLMAELILSYADSIIAQKAEEKNITDYHIIRYRDDYRVFCNDKNNLEMLSLVMQKVLAGLNFRINNSKTYVVEDLVLGSLKKDKLATLNLFLHRKDLDGSNMSDKRFMLQKELLSIYSFSKQYPNSGSVERLLGDLYDWFINANVKDCNWKVLAAILISIAKDNPRTYGIVAAIISSFIDKIMPYEKKDLIECIYKNVSKWPNSGLLMVWLQRITLKIDRNFKYDEMLCKVVVGEKVDLWNNKWLDSTLLHDFSNDIFISRDILDNMHVAIDKQTVSPFYEYIMR